MPVCSTEGLTLRLILKSVVVMMQKPRITNITALLAILAGVVIVTLDISLTSTALPEIARGIGTSSATSIWIVNIYYLAVVAALLSLAALGEIYGHRRIFFGGLLVFAVGSLISSMSTSLPMLMAGRALLGFGAAAVSATTPALIRSVYPPERLTRGLGLYALVVSMAFAAGPPTASAVLSVTEWPWLYLLNAPVAVIVLGLAIKGLPETERIIRQFDLVACVLCAVTFACLLFALAGMAHFGLPPIFAALAGFGICGAALLKREAGQTAPLLAADLFRRPAFALSALTSICSFSVQGLVFVSLPFIFLAMGFTQVEAGLLILPWPATLIVMTIIAARLSDYLPPGLLGGIGLALLAAGLALLAGLPEGANDLAIGWRLVMCGVGFGLFQSPNMVAFMRSAPKERSGGAGGVLALSRLLGQSIGAAAVAFWMSSGLEAGPTAALWSGVAVALLGACFSVLRLLPSIRVRVDVVQ